jgi:hypothetical protein
MAAAGVAAISAFEVVRRSEDEGWAFVVEVLRGEFLRGPLGFLLC